jgi:NTP pyrophosphatase (non-canonical NTP hydrolase)
VKKGKRGKVRLTDRKNFFTLSHFHFTNMNFKEYQSKASLTALYPNRFRNLEYPTLGLAGEAGEVANIVKKIQRDFGGEITDEIRAKLKDELGDVLWYVSACADELGLTLQEIAEFNVEKLAERHNRKT